MVGWTALQVEGETQQGELRGGGWPVPTPPGPSCLTMPAGPAQVYPPSSGDDYSRDTTAYPPTKTPSGTYPASFYVAGT